MATATHPSRIESRQHPQPWAHLIVHGPKRVENRTWEPHGLRIGDYLAIHAGRLDFSRRGSEMWAGAVETAQEAGLLGTLPVLDGLLALPRGERGDRFAVQRVKAYVESACAYSAVVGVVRLAGVEHRRPADGDPWWFGPVGWRFDEVVAFEPVSVKRGAQGLWPLEVNDYKLVRERYGEARRAA